MVKKMVDPVDVGELDFNDLHPKSDNKEDNRIYHEAKAICVVLEKDTKKSDLDAVMAAIEQLKGVAVVKFIDLTAFHDYPNRVRVKMEIRKKIDNLLDIGDSNG